MKNQTSQYSDQELCILLSDQGSSADAAFAEIYSRYSSRLHAYCVKILNDYEEASDIFQETFIRFVQAVRNKNEMSNVPAFLLRIARNLCLNAKRDKKQTTEPLDYMLVSEDRNYDKKQLLDLIDDALSKLTDEYKEAFVLREYDGFSYQEIAEITGLSLSNVKIRVVRAKNQIRELLQPYIKELS